MLRIITHIERLLLVHDCVIVPKFGGFVLQTVPAVYEAEEHTFRPVRKEIGFNGTLQHSDGLLGESYMQMYGVGYRQAQLMLEEDIDDMKATLLQYKKLSLGILGAFSIGEEGQLVFYPAETDLFSVASYGLPAFHFPVLASLQPEKEEVKLLTSKNQKRDTVYIPVSRKFIRTAVASAAAVALFLLVSTPVKDVNQAAYTASFVPSEVVSYKVPVVEMPVTEIAVIESEQPVSVTKSAEKSASASVAPTPEVKKLQPATSKPAPEKNEVKSNPKMYHIVIASFPTETQANEYISGIDKKDCKHVSKVSRDGKFRIYADKFDNRKDAEDYMATLRTNPKYKDAWLFISK